MTFPQLDKILLSPASPEVVQHIVEMFDTSCGLSWGDLKVFIIKWVAIS